MSADDEAVLRDRICREFQVLYYYSRQQTWLNTSWLGVPLAKCPLDLWVYQEILVRNRPDVIVETGTFKGGSALFLASICDLINHGRIVTIDIAPQPDLPRHPRIKYLTGSSVSDEIVGQVKERIAPGSKAMVILDSDHSCDHVLAELRHYHALVGPGQYLIVEDSNIGGHPVVPEAKPGPMEAMAIFLKETAGFAVDKSMEKFMMTFNPNGYLKRMG